MTKFTDGPAAGKTLQLTRMPMPFFLRVVRSPEGAVDALDQLDDRPEPHEEIFVYRKVSDDGTVHIDGRDAKTGKRFGRTYNSCTYALHETQPDQATLRDHWPAWCQEEFDRLKKADPARYSAPQ